MAARTPQRPSTGDDAHTVTLITGDRVTLTTAGRAPSLRIDPGPGRAQIGFVTIRNGDDVTVIPKDVAALVAADRLDRGLFDITRLLADGFNDRDAADLPLIVTGGVGPAAAAPSARIASADVVVDRVLPALHAAVVRQHKPSPGAVLQMLPPTSTATARGLATAGTGAKIWLDRRYHPLLDHSVPQIGGPAAVARGFTGAGVTVAVLDTGIDASHPDLAGKVVDAEEFVGDGLGTSDVVGHATHVASIIAGTGAASGGRFHGVAPDARLLSGRVCSQFFCPESAILAGLEWAAVDRHAAIVNLSIGAFPDPGSNPVDDAVNQLAAEHGTLFVAAAGNEGGPGAIDSPGTADAALTVGAVDRDDQLAEFSSRGPTADQRIKPELTAPGVDITAARASGLDPIGEPVGDAYQRLSGTSMAAPHVSGAAALLLQQHPTWTGAQLKAALTGAAAPDPALEVFAQGAGRVDIDRATRQLIAADTATLSLGLARWPHDDDPVLTHTVTYRNDGTAAITLALAVSLALPDHTAAPPGMIHVEPTTLTVAAGGSASATVTVDTRGDARDGSYAGAVIASAGDTRIITPVAIVREVESYDLTLRTTGRDGNPNSTFAILQPRHAGVFGPVLRIDGEVTLRLPRDEYGVYAISDDPVFLAAPRVVLDHDTTVDLDERLGEPVDVTVRGTALDVGLIDASTLDGPIQFRVDQLNVGQLFTAQIGAAPSDFRSWVVVSATPSGAPDAPDRYAFAHQEHGRLFTGWRARLAPGDLATVDARHVAADHSTMRRFLVALLDGVPGLIGQTEADFVDYPAVARRVEHVFGPGFRWATVMAQFEPFFVDDPRFRFNVDELIQVRSYRAGQHYLERWHHAPFGPSLAATDTGAMATRLGDTLDFGPSQCADRNVPARSNETDFDSRRMTLLRDGVTLVDTTDRDQPWFPPLDVPPGAATYRFEQDITRGTNPFTGLPKFELSTHVTAAWTFRSQHVGAAVPAVIPAVTPRFVPDLDDTDTASGPVLVLPVLFERPDGAPARPIASAAIEVSFDDGAHWVRVPGVIAGDRFVGIVLQPRGAAFASLRADVADIDGNRGEVTLIRAYHVAR
jgi:subtilisin family serine protease